MLSLDSESTLGQDDHDSYFHLQRQYLHKRPYSEVQSRQAPHNPLCWVLALLIQPTVANVDIVLQNSLYDQSGEYRRK
jgi:hypothetical protein